MIHLSALDCESGLIRYREKSFTTEKGEKINTVYITFDVNGRPVSITIHSKNNFILVEDELIF